MDLKINEQISSIDKKIEKHKRTFNQELSNKSSKISFLIDEISKLNKVQEEQVQDK
jgi:hypothetical protein